MSLRLNNKYIKDFIISGKHVSRVMLMDEIIWPEFVTENFELILDINYSIENPNKAFSIEYLEMFDKDYNKINFTNIERIGNIDPVEKPLNIETVIDGESTRCSISTDFGIFDKTDIPAFIEPEPSGNNYAYAWLPDSVGVCSYSSKGSSYNGYRYFISAKNTPIGNYKIVVNSEGDTPVKYLAFTPGYHGDGLNLLKYEPYNISFRNKNLYNYSNRNEFINGETINVNGVNWKARYIVSTTGDVYKCWHRNWYTNPAYLGEMYLCKIFYFTKDNTDDAEEITRSMVPATLEDIVTKSDKNGYLKENYELNSVIDFSSFRGQISSSQNFHVLTAMLLYDENLELINKAGLSYSLTGVNGSSNVNNDSSCYAIGNDEQDAFVFESDNGYYNANNYTYASLLGYDNEYSTAEGYVMGCSTNSISNQNSEVNYKLKTNKKVKVMALPLVRVCNNFNSEFITKLTINNTIIKDFGNENPALKGDIKVVNGFSYAKRYFFNLESAEIFVSYVLSGQITDTINTFRTIYVYDNFKRTMDEITIEELLTGKYIDGEYTSFTPASLSEYSFTFRYPAYSTTIYYTVMQYLSLLDINGLEITKMKEILLDGYLDGKISNSISSQFLLTNNEKLSVISEAGVYSKNYLMSKMFNPDSPLLDAFLTAGLPADNNTFNTPRQIKFYFENSDYFMLFSPFWYYPSSGKTPYTSCLYLQYDNNDNQVLKNFKDFNESKNNEYRIVKGVGYYRKILASVHKAYIVFTKQPHDISPLYKYNKEFDTMIEVTIKDIVDNDLIDENIVTPPLTTNDGSEFYIKIARPIRLADTTQTGDYIPIRNGVIWIEDNDGGFKKVESDSYEDVLYTTKVELGKDENDYTAMQRFKDADGNIYEIATDNGCYSASNSYQLWNILSSINKDGTETQYGYLGKQNPGNERFFKFNFKSTAKIKALVLTFLYQNNTYNFYEGVAKLKFKEDLIFDYNNSTETTNSFRREGFQARFVFFPDRDEVMKVFTPAPVIPVSKFIDTGLYLWNRNSYEYVEFTIEELYNLDKTRLNYNFEEASYAVPEEFANQLEFFVGSVLSQYNNNDYNSMGNCLLFDENNEIINLTFKSQTRNNSSLDAAYGGKYHTTIWEDDRGNEFKLIQNGFAYSNTKSAFPYTMLTPATNTMLVNTNNSNASQDFWYTRQGLKSSINQDTGKPNILCHMRFLGKTRKIGAIAISETCNHSYSKAYAWYQYAFSHIYFKPQNASTGEEIVIREKTTLADLINDYFLVINNKRWLKRRIILEDGTVIVTWLWYNKFTS